MKKLVLIILFLGLSKLIFSQTAIGVIDQTIIFQIIDDKGSVIPPSILENTQIRIHIDSVENELYQGIQEKKGYTLVRKAARVIGDFNYIFPTNVTLTYWKKAEKMTLTVNNIAAATLIIYKIPFKKGDFVIDLQKNHGFIESQKIEITDWSNPIALGFTSKVKKRY